MKIRAALMTGTLLAAVTAFAAGTSKTETSTGTTTESGTTTSGTTTGSTPPATTPAPTTSDMGTADTATGTDTTTGTRDTASDMGTTSDTAGSTAMGTSSLSSDHIRDVQNALNRDLTAGLEVDGQMGAKTIEALREYQRQNNLAVTGQADAATLESLGIDADVDRAPASVDETRTIEDMNSTDTAPEDTP